VEVFLNLAWSAVAATIVCLWFRYRNRTSADRRVQWIALAVLIAILLPVISVSDDLLAIQNASEADSSLRRDHLVGPNAHAPMPAQITLLMALFAGLPFGFLHLISPDREPIIWLTRPESASIQNRPPPAA